MRATAGESPDARRLPQPGGAVERGECGTARTNAMTGEEIDLDARLLQRAQHTRHGTHRARRSGEDQCRTAFR
jgi:hypothetical protein